MANPRRPSPTSVLASFAVLGKPRPRPEVLGAFLDRCPANLGNHQKTFYCHGFLVSWMLWPDAKRYVITKVLLLVRPGGGVKIIPPRHHPKNRPTPCRNSWGTCRLPDRGCWTIPGHALGKCLKSPWGVLSKPLSDTHTKGLAARGSAWEFPNNFL